MKRIAIIGAGFSGAVIAIELLKKASQELEIVLINRSGKMARGLAYGTNSAHHLLNVPAGNMSALEDEPSSFLKFCEERDPSITAQSFVPRALYGAYLEHLLTASQVTAKPRFRQVAAEVFSVEKSEDGVLLNLSTGEQMSADHVVLAFGNFPSAAREGWSNVEESEVYLSDPWSLAIDRDSKRVSRILLIGTGLTAVDALVSIRNQNPDIEVLMISRRGLIPKAHKGAQEITGRGVHLAAELQKAAPSASSYLKIIRNGISDSPEAWRDLIALLRPITSELWARLPVSERTRLLKHLQPYWDTHRHRIAPISAQALANALEEGKAEVIAGHILEIKRVGHAAEVSIRRRKNQVVETGLFDRVINCTGPCTDVERLDDHLIRDLLNKSLITADPLKLGIMVDPNYHPLGSSGTSSTWLSYVGPMLRAQLWEATAVPELRKHARLLASKLMAQHGLG